MSLTRDRDGDRIRAAGGADPEAEVRAGAAAQARAPADQPRPAAIAAPRPGPAGADRADLARRVAALEAERWHILRDAQQEADTMFAQYQLSQLLATGDSLRDMAEAVLEELARGTGAAAAALWLTAPGTRTMRRVAVEVGAGAPGAGASGVGDGGDGPVSASVPGQLADAAAAEAWCAGHGWYGVALEEQRDLGEGGLVPLAVGFVGLAAPAGRSLAADHARFLALVRHELAIAFRAAQLREALVHERATMGAILDGARDAIVAVDDQRRVVRLNAATVRLTGQDGEAAIGRTCQELLGCAVPAGQAAGTLLCGARCPFAEVLEGGDPVAEREVEVLGADRTPIPVAGSYARMSGGPGGAVSVLRDLRPTRQLDQLKASFVAAVSHELRTPLALIRGYAQSLEQLELSETTRRTYVQRIERTTERLGGLVDQIMEIARIDSDSLSLDLHPVALAALIRRLARELGAAPGRPTIRASLEADLPAVTADEGRAAQVLINLIDNAVKYGPPDAPVRVVAERPGGGDEVVVRVIDAGPGIDDEEREHVFERFYRGRRVRESSRPGSGLGLYLCRRLIEAQGGRIWLDDVPRGTSIAFSLPVAEA
ncbi:MAG TPA: ATP-binding protein [Candidatus Limnocylindrales bacterium]|nr:ATP-binding protein [Candidatus Limnocylindrales bacterium]